MMKDLRVEREREEEEVRGSKTFQNKVTHFIFVPMLVNIKEKSYAVGQLLSTKKLV